MTPLRFILAGASLILAGACGGNDQDISQEVGEAENTPAYVTPQEDSGTSEVLATDPDPSRTVDEEIVPTPETDMDVEPEIEEPVTPDTATDAEPMPEDGMPQPETAPQ